MIIYDGFWLLPTRNIKPIFKGKMMSIQSVSFQECSNQFPNIFERVLKNHEVISVRKESEQEVVILDAKEYSSLIETLYLLSNPINANRLREGISQHQQGRIREIDVKTCLDSLKGGHTSVAHPTNFCFSP